MAQFRKSSENFEPGEVERLSFWSSHFADPELEAAFWERTFLVTRKIWMDLTIVLMISLTFISAGYWAWTEDPKPYVTVSLVTLFLVCFISRLALTREWFRGSRHLIPAFCAIAGQTAAMPIVLLSPHWATLSPIAYICVIVGGNIHVGRNIRMFLVLYPVLVYTTFLGVQLSSEFSRFTVYHFGFITIVASLALLSSRNRERAERIEFIASTQRAAALRKADLLLANVLPESIAEKVKAQEISNVRLVEHYESVTVMFVDIVGFTDYAARHSPESTIDLLGNVFRRFDAIVEQCGVEKIKTIGDAYMTVSGLPDRVEGHALRIANAAFEMREAMAKLRFLLGIDLELRIGIHSGPVIAGILGTKKFLYDIWGDTVNTASRLESHGIPGSIQISQATKDLLGDSFNYRERGAVRLKGKGDMEVFILESPRLPQDSFAA
jgi:class 3 adenylate cyclase